MPQHPQADCPLCGGTGEITDPELTRLTGPARKAGDPVICLCTVSQEEIKEALPGVIAGILAKPPFKSG